MGKIESRLTVLQAAQNARSTRPQEARRLRRTVSGTSQGVGRPRTKLAGVFSSRQGSTVTSTKAGKLSAPILS
jgi:hypothetical protein